MTRTKASSPNTAERWAFECVYIVVALAAAYYYCILRSMLTEHGGGWEGVQSVAEGTAAKPWQYRIFIPYLVKAVLALRLPGLSSWDTAYNAVEAGFVFLMLLAFRFFLSSFFRDRATAALLSLGILLVLPFNIFFPRPYHPFYCFDIPSVMFFCAGLALIHRKNWAWYYPVFILATLNRETACFLTVVYLFTSWGREKNGRVLAHVAAQALLWLVIKSVLFKVYAASPGFAMELYDSPGITHWADNLAFFSNPRNYPMFLSIFAYLWIPPLFFYRRIGDDFVRRSLWVFFPYFAGMMVVANIYELRIFVELIPVFFAGTAMVLKGSESR